MDPHCSFHPGPRLTCILGYLIQADAVCPFCLTGLRQLLFALDKYAMFHPSDPIIPEIRFLPYQLAWNLTEQPEDRIESRRRRLGVERANAVQAALTEKFRDVGLR